MDSRTKAFAHFKKADKRFHAVALRHLKSLPKELSIKTGNAALFEALCSIVVSQQLGVKAADAIFIRVKKAVGGRITPMAIRNVRREALRKAGLSGSKVKTLTAIADAVLDKRIELRSLALLSQEEAKSRLTKIWGVGPWSSEMFLIFALGHTDIFSPGDLGLLRAIEAIYKLPKNAPRERILEIAKRWAPHRTWASLILWKSRDNTPPLSPGRHR